MATKLLLEFFLSNGTSKSCVFTVKGGGEVVDKDHLRQEYLEQIESRVWQVAFSLGIREDDVDAWELVLPQTLVHVWSRQKQTKKEGE